MRRHLSMIRRLAGLVLLGAGLATFALPVAAAQVEITSDGPLTRIIITDELNCQVAHRADSDFELYGGEVGACGTFLVLDGVLYGPSSVPAGVTPNQAWTPVSQSAVAGQGTETDPYRIVTVVAAGDTGVSVEQTDSYVVGRESYRTDIRVINTGEQPHSGILYRAGDCYLQESDTGFGRVDGGAPACVTERVAGSRIEQWQPLTPGSRYVEGQYSDVWALIASQQAFPNTCACEQRVDNGAGLSWPVSVAAGQTQAIAQQTFFSPAGRAVIAAESFRESLPSPTQISLDPIVIVQSVLLTAGVVLLMPFPAALFNETLEANYDEVRGWVARVGGWVVAGSAASAAVVRRQLNQRRAPPAEGPPPGAPLAGAATTAVAPATGPVPDVTRSPAPPASAVAEQRDFWRTPLGIAAFILPSALVYSFLDPTFGLSLESLATLAGLAVGLGVVIAAYAIPLLLFARVRGIDVVVKALPVTLAIGVFFVVLSRAANFEPGYVYGLVIGALFARSASEEQQGRAEAVGAGSLLAVAGLAWLSLLVIRGAGSSDLASLTFETAAVTIAVAGVEGALFAMLPLSFMPGGAVFAWSRRVWAVLVGVGALGFLHVLIDPQNGYLAEGTSSSFLSMVLLFVAFGVVSVVFWAYFRYRPRPGGQPTPA